MNIESQGQNLIFLISQPRAGSTLLQRILGSHPTIHTTSEPWLMLQPFNAIYSEKCQAEYDAKEARVAVHNFLQTLPGKEDEYFEGVNRMYGYLYERALTISRKRYFLDKTPRYYFIIPELYKTFPNAHYIILLRNPLAVLCSVLKTWAEDDLLSLYLSKNDLIQAPGFLLEGIKCLGKRGMIVYYEQLLRDPESEIQRICSGLDIKFMPDMIEYGRHSLPHWQLGDQGAVYQHKRPASKNVDAWVQTLGDPQIWRLASDYLQLLGQETVEQLGYSYEELLRILQTGRTHQRPFRSPTLSLAWLLEKPIEDRKIWELWLVRLIRSLQRRGIWGMVLAVVQKVTHIRFNPEETSFSS